MLNQTMGPGSWTKPRPGWGAPSVGMVSGGNAQLPSMAASPQGSVAGTIAAGGNQALPSYAQATGNPNAKPFVEGSLAHRTSSMPSPLQAQLSNAQQQLQRLWGIGDEAGVQNAYGSIANLQNQMGRLEGRPGVAPPNPNIVKPGAFNAPWGSVPGINIGGQQALVPPGGGAYPSGPSAGNLSGSAGSYMKYGAPGGPGAGGASIGPFAAAGLGGNQNSIILSSAYQDAHDQAKQSNEQRYQDILGGYGTLGDQQQAGYDARYARNMDYLNGYGEQQLADTNRRYSDQAAANKQSLVSRGIANSTVADSVNMVNERERGEALNRVNDSLARQRVDVDSRLSQDALSVPGQIAKDQLAFMERRTDEYPDMSQLLALQQALGQSGNPGYGNGEMTPGERSKARSEEFKARRNQVYSGPTTGSPKKSTVQILAEKNRMIQAQQQAAKNGAKVNSSGNKTDWELPAGGYIAGVQAPNYYVPEQAYGQGYPNLVAPSNPSERAKKTPKKGGTSQADLNAVMNALGGFLQSGLGQLA